MMTVENLCRIFGDASPISLLALDVESLTIRYVNPAVSKMLGRSNAELLGLSISEVTGGVDVTEIVKRVVQTGDFETLSNVPGAHDSSRFWSYAFWTLKSTVNQDTWIIVQMTDVTDAVVFRKRSIDMNQSLLAAAMQQHELTEKAEKLNTELQSANEAKNQFLAVMSHEIRTPLNAIMGFSDLLSLSDQSQSDRELFTDRLQRNSQLLLRLIDDILDLSKIEAGKFDVESVEFDFTEIVSDVETIIRQTATAKGIDFSLQYLNEMPHNIVSDPTRLKQILTNIIGNSIKFTAMGFVHVTVKTDPHSQFLEFLVEDTGRGMSAEDQVKLFQPFTQGNSTTTRRFGGTGLGLDLSRRLARRLGGDVTLLRSEEGKGSLFEIKIAFVEKNPLQDERPKLRASAPTYRLDGLSVLLADDAADNRFLISRYLTTAGATVDFAHDGEEAVSKALAGHYDIVLMDIQMPKLDGYSATRLLRKNGFRDPVIALTAHAMQDEVERCRLAGCDLHLAKPVGRRDLVDNVHLVTSRLSRDAAIGGNELPLLN